MRSSRPVRVVVVDDEQLLRTALAALLPLDGTIEVVAQVGRGADAASTTLELRPDVVVMDVEMPGVGGLDAVAHIRSALPDQPILMLTRHARPSVLRRALELGVLGFISKNTDPDDIAEAIREVHAGRRWITHDVLEASIVADSPLTRRESDVLRETTDGYSVKEIARRQYLAPGTVRNYLSSAMQKTGTTTRHRAARIAGERGWL